MGPNYYYQAPVAQKPPSRFSRKFLLIIAACVIALIIAIVLTFSRGPSLGEELVAAASKQSQLAVFVADNREEVRDPRLQNISADAALFFATDAHELAKSGGGSLAEDTSEPSEEDTIKLEEAMSKGRFDQTFSEMLDTKIDAQQAVMREIAAKTADADVKTSLNRTYTNLELIRSQLDKL